MDKLPEQSINLDNKIVKWFKNYWYYYKWWVIGALFVIAVITVCTWQSCSTTKADIKILYAGSYPSSGEAVPGMRDAFSTVLSSESDGEEKPEVALVMYHIFSDEQIAELEKDPDVTVNATSNRQEYNNFQRVIASSEYYLCVLEPWLYDVLNEKGMVVPLEEVLGYTPDNSINGNAMKLLDTEFARYFESMGVLTEDTYICLRAPGVIQDSTGKGKDSYEFKTAQQLLKAIIEFTAPKK